MKSMTGSVPVTVPVTVAVTVTVTVTATVTDIVVMSINFLSFPFCCSLLFLYYQWEPVKPAAPGHKMMGKRNSHYNGTNSDDGNAAGAGPQPQQDQGQEPVDSLSITELGFCSRGVSDNVWN
jgi:hypothetical protein